MKKILFCFLCLLIWIFYLGSCSVSNDDLDCESGYSCNVKMACWNAQTFFDAKINGNEYAEFKKREYWNNEKYIIRLERLCDVMMSIDADIFVLEEVESIGVVQDISNYLTNGSWIWVTSKKALQKCKEMIIYTILLINKEISYLMNGLKVFMIFMKALQECKEVMVYGTSLIKREIIYLMNGLCG